MKTSNRRQFLQASTLAAISSFPAVAGPSPAPRIKAAQIGTKHPHAAGKLKTLLDLEALYEVVGVAEADDAQQRRMAEQQPYRDLPWLTEETLLADPAIEVVAVETGIDHLVPTAMRCLEAGKHIHLDKPAGQSMAACRDMHAEAGKRDLTVQMGYMFRYNPAFTFLFRAVEEGWLGEIAEVHGHIGKRASAELRQELAQYPGGGLFELACHLIDAMVTVLGQPREVSAIHNRLHEDSFKDNQLAVFRYPKALATIGSNHSDPFGGSRRQFNVVGTKGSVEIRPLEPPNVRLALTEPHGGFAIGVHEVDLMPAEGRYHGEFRDLAKVVRGEKELAWDAAHDLAVQETLLRASGLPLDS